MMVSNQFTTPREIHGYRVIEPIGEGAASRLYVVSDPRSRSLHALKHVTARGARDRRRREGGLECGSGAGAHQMS